MKFTLRTLIIAAGFVLAVQSPVFAEKPQAPDAPLVGSTKPNTPAGGGMQRVNPAALQNTNALKNVDMNGPARIMQCQKDCEGKFPKQDVAAAEKALNYAQREEKPNKTKIEKLKMDLERTKTRANERDRNVRQCQSACSTAK